MVIFARQHRGLCSALVMRYICCSGLREVLRDLDFHVTQVAFSSDSFAFLFVGIIGFGCPRGTAFQATVPVMRDKWFAFVFLRRSMGIDIVDVREINLKPISVQSLIAKYEM